MACTLVMLIETGCESSVFILSIVSLDKLFSLTH